MPVKVRCPQCSKDLAAPDAARGKAIRCPDCQTKIPVPADSAGTAPSTPTTKSVSRPAATSGKTPARKPAPKAAVEPGHHDDDFLSSLDLRHAEDQSMRVCAKCGKLVGEEDDECPYCGMDTRTGQMTAIARKKSMMKGPDPEEFNATAWRDPWKFTLENKSLWLRSMIYTVLTFSLLAFCLYMAWMVSERMPPRYFWMSFAFCLALVVPGWYWHLTMLTIQRTMSKKTDLGTVHFDMFLNMAAGLKIIIWNLVFYGIPALIPGIPIAIAAFLVSWKLLWLLLIVVPIFCWLQPVGLAHMAMPITKRGWLSPLCARPFFKTVGRTLYVMTILFVVNFLPLAMIGGGMAIINWDVNQKYFVYYADPRPVIKDVEDLLKKANDVKKKPKDFAAVKEELETRLKELKKAVDLNDEKLTEAYVKVSGFRNLDWSRPRLTDANLNAAYDLRWTWWMWMLIGSFTLLTGMLILTFTAVFSMRLMGQYAYFFHERLELVTDPPEEEFVRMLPHRAGALLAMVIVAAFLPLGGGILGTIALKMAKIDLEDMKTGRRDPKGRKKTKRVITISTLISLFWLMVTVFVVFTWSLGVWPFTKEDVPEPPPEEKPAVKRNR